MNDLISGKEPIRRNIRILLVGQDEVFVQIGRYLDEMAFHTKVCPDATTIMETAYTFFPQLIFVGISVPPFSGEEIVKTLKGMSSHLKAHIIQLTDRPYPFHQRGKSTPSPLESDDYLFLPMSFTSLYALINKWNLCDRQASSQRI